MSAIGVVVPYFEDERRLSWVLLALATQTCVMADLHVVVADDGSAHAPALPELPYRIDLVRQEDLGFRAAAARNLGAAHVDGDLVVFLDGDTIPSPDYLTAMATAYEQVGPGFLGVGRRLHADFEGCSAAQVSTWVREGPPAARVLPAPWWLADGYRRTDDLREAGDEDFRLVISAVLALDRELLARSGGFDESMTGYGGEDWELAWRCRLLGARMRYVPAALAWHDGPEAVARTGDRSASRAVKDAESLALAERITLPSVRGRGLIWELPDIVVRVHGQHNDAQVFATALALLRRSDVGVWWVDHAAVPAALTADPRVHVGSPPSRVSGRGRYQVDVWAPLQLSCPLIDACAAGEIHVAGILQIRSTRQLALGLPAPAPTPAPGWVHELPDEGLEQMMGKAARDG
ncbi:glycosyltransferase [Dermatophilaceae bacterium Sec6.4]